MSDSSKKAQPYSSFTKEKSSTTLIKQMKKIFQVFAFIVLCKRFIPVIKCQRKCSFFQIWFQQRCRFFQCFKSNFLIHQSVAFVKITAPKKQVLQCHIVTRFDRSERGTGFQNRILHV